MWTTICYQDPSKTIHNAQRERLETHSDREECFAVNESSIFNRTCYVLHYFNYIIDSY